TVPLVVDRDITIANLTVSLTATYPNTADLTIQLKGPDGTTVNLFNQRGNGANMKATLFDDSASTPISSGSAPFAGTYRPEGALSAFKGKNAHGTWQLLISNRPGVDHGRLNLFTLNIADTPGSGGASVEIVTVSAPQGESHSIATADVAEAGT